MTLPEVHTSPAALARYLGVPFAAGTLPDGTWSRYGLTTSKPATAEEIVAHAWDRYRAALAEDYQRTHRPQTWSQFIAECLREGLGIRKAGKLADRLDYARMTRPDLYGTA